MWRAVEDGAGRPGQAAEAGAEAALSTCVTPELADATGFAGAFGEAATDAATSARQGRANDSFKSFLRDDDRIRGGFRLAVRRPDIVTGGRCASSAMCGRARLTLAWPHPIFIQMVEY